MGGDVSVFGGFVSSTGGSQTETYWGDIQGNIDSQTDLSNRLDNKMDKQEDKGLSTNDYTNEDKEKLEKINTVLLVALIPNQWEYSSESNMYYQDTIVENIYSTDTVEVYISFNSNEEIAAKEDFYWNNITRIITNDGFIRTYINGDIPDVTLNIKVKF